MGLSQLSEAARRERLLQFIDVVCHGSQGQAATRLGVGASTICRAASGAVPVSRRMLHAIASIPNINSDWLTAGEGSPICTTPKILTDIGSIVPVARKLLPGPLLEHEDLLSSEFIAVPRASYGASVYAIPVSVLVAGMVTAFATRLLQDRLFKPDDTLLIDTEVATIAVKWGNSPGIVLRNGEPVFRDVINDGSECVGVVTQLFRSF